MELIIGSHVGVSKDKMLLGAVEETINNHANAMMFYTGAPQNMIRKPIESFNLDSALSLMKQNNILVDNVFIHAPYLINLANDKENGTANLSINFTKSELERVNALGFKYLILHPGAHVGLGEEVGITALVRNLNRIFEEDKSSVMILIESMSGKGSEIGINLDQLQKIIEGVTNKDRMGICLDTCHLHDSGVDLKYFNQYLEEFEQKIGLKYLKCIHINDSKNIINAHKDRHENFGLGKIGFENLINIIYHPKLEKVAKILETPYIGENSPYKAEIQMIKDKKINYEIYKDLGKEGI